MPSLSGKQGRVTQDDAPLADITRWRLTTTADNVAYASSATNGFRRQIPGARHGFGSFAFQLNVTDAVPARLQSGDLVTLHLYVDATRAYVVPAVIETVALAVEIASGDVVTGQAEFATDGAWTEPAFD